MSGTIVSGLVCVEDVHVYVSQEGWDRSFDGV
jgi:hypothetical protein